MTGKDLKSIGFTEGKALGIALQTISRHYSSLPQDEQLILLKEVAANPREFLEDEKLAPIAQALLSPIEPTISLQPIAQPYRIYGIEAIEEGALRQMDTAMRLPISVAGALMPDAHQGYGLPIGGVLATQNAIIPYGVGVDIGCRMCMTLYDIPDKELTSKRELFRNILLENTRFGFDTFRKPIDHEIIERLEFREIPIVRELKDRAWQQLGTSGGGNHFVEFGWLDVREPIEPVGIQPGRYVALLSHSGSRGLGANIARHYTKLAMDICKLPSLARHLAWLTLDSEEGIEYWKAMNLAGDYASACHHQIHDRIAAALGQGPLVRIENHHNFAWKERDEHGNEVIVHRKGATPASKGTLGIIPGSMATPGYVVRGKGNPQSINSASHGAGRTMSRTKAKQSILPGQVRKALKEAGVDLIGAGLDEAPMAYKDIRQVMRHQDDLIEILGEFMPKIVRMCGDNRFQEVD